jgi:hypothetical protein
MSARGAGRLVASLALAAALFMHARAASAEIRRIAVVVGSNHGDGGHTPLRFAEQDAAKLSAVLGEIGGLLAGDLMLLRGPTLAEVRAALDEAARRIAAWHAVGRGQAVLLFYFSGHSDGEVLELGGQPLPFGELRRRLRESGADVRLAIVDSCRSGALLALKGGTLGQPFDIRMADDLGSTGEAFIASSAADEAALESAEIGASFFSHHFISGLRGAADLSGDGLVTLAEAYQYAFARTLRATSDTVVGPQHPAYDYHLAGRGELVLTELHHPSAALDLPGGFDRLLLVEMQREQVIAEIGPRSAHRIAVGPGDYRLRAWRGGKTFVGQVHLAQGQERRIAESDLAPAASPGTAVASKGEGGAVGSDPELAIAARATLRAAAPHGSTWGALASFGVGAGVADGAAIMGGRLAIERDGGLRRLSLAVLAGTGRTDGMRESRFGAELTATWWTGDDSIRLGAGAGVGSGVALEHTDAGAAHWSGLGWAAAVVRVAVPLPQRLAIEVAGELPVALLRRDGSNTVALLPSGWVGLSRAF